MHSQLLEYFSVNKILSSQQYGFIPNRSTKTAALELMERNITAKNEQLTPINIHHDLSKVFDSIDHNILVSKHKYNGIQGMTLNLLKNMYSVDINMLILIAHILISRRFRDL